MLNEKSNHISDVSVMEISQFQKAEQQESSKEPSTALHNPLSVHDLPKTLISEIATPTVIVMDQNKSRDQTASPKKESQ